MSGETLLFDRTDEGVVLRGAWRERIRVATCLLTHATTFAVWREGDDVLRIRVANGQAAYRIVEEDPVEEVLVCELAYSERWP